NKNNREIDTYRENLTGVPNFIVNGKYQATFSRDMTPDDIVNLIVWLTKQS
ncbi:MAG: thiol:disulfide interchange protein DsbA, partial [Glaciecola sp.]